MSSSSERNATGQPAARRRLSRLPRSVVGCRETPTSVPLIRPPAPPKRPANSIRAKEQFTGIILGIAIGSIRQRDTEGKVIDYFLCQPGDDVQVTFPSAGTPPKALSDQFTVVDFYESKMSEYDSGFAFVPLRQAAGNARHDRSTTGTMPSPRFSSSSSRAADLNAVRDKLRARFPADRFAYRIQTWRDMRARCSPPCRWRRRSSTSCCS